MRNRKAVEMRLTTLIIGLIIFFSVIMSSSLIITHFNEAYKDVGGVDFITTTAQGNSLTDTYYKMSYMQELTSNISSETETSGLDTDGQIPILTNMWRMLKTIYKFTVGSIGLIGVMLTDLGADLGIPSWFIYAIFSIVIVLIISAFVNMFTKGKL